MWWYQRLSCVEIVIVPVRCYVSYGMLLLRLAYLTTLLILARLLPCRSLFGCRFLYPVQVGTWTPRTTHWSKHFPFWASAWRCGFFCRPSTVSMLYTTTYSVKQYGDVPLRPVRAFQLSYLRWQSVHVVFLAPYMWDIKCGTQIDFDHTAITAAVTAGLHIDGQE
jgi:hypothetical protein